ncbi:MAG: hypothetical protein ACYDB3_10050, partial [Acidimicrobiales bacterium]
EADWFFALNSDAWPEPGALGTLLEAARRHRRAAAVAPLLLRPGGAVEHSVHAFPSVTTSWVDAVGGRRWLPKRWLAARCFEGSMSYDSERPVDWAVGAALLMRAEAVRDVGGFDERFFMYVEDIEWCWRARQSGWEVRFEPAAVVRHVGNASGARRFGHRRPALEASNLYAFFGSIHGRAATTALRAANTTAAAERYLGARLRRRHDDAAYWKLIVRSHLGHEPPPSVGPEVAEPSESSPTDFRRSET